MLTVEFERLDLKPGQRVLDLGCGEGRHVRGLQGVAGLTLVGLDLDPSQILAAKAAGASLPTEAALVEYVIGDATRLPFTDDDFDVVICSEVLEHIPDYQATLGEIRRILKPGGVLAATVPRAWPERICWALASGAGGYADQPGGHIRIFDEAALRRELEGLGLAFRGKHYAHGLHAPFWWLKCALWKRRDDHPLVKLYHRFLVWDLMQRPWLTRALDAVVTPLAGKSLALYYRKAPSA